MTPIFIQVDDGIIINLSKIRYISDVEGEKEDKTITYKLKFFGEDPHSSGLLGTIRFSSVQQRQKFKLSLGIQYWTRFMENGIQEQEDTTLSRTKFVEEIDRIVRSITSMENYESVALEEMYRNYIVYGSTKKGGN